MKTRAAVLYEVHEPLRVVSLDMDDPKAGEVRVRIGAAGICLSDHHIMEGTGTAPRPVVLGHEGSGTVEEVGPGVTSVKAGDRCILSFVSNCGHCRTCRSGAPQMCLTNRLTGGRQFDGTTRLTDGEGQSVFQLSKIGVFSERSVVPAQACYPVAADVSMEVLGLIGCCVTTGVGAVINNPFMRAGATIAVFGTGGVGTNVVQGARLMNAAKVIAVDTKQEKLDFVKRFGATDLVNASEWEPVAAVKDLSGGGVDFAFEVFGSGKTVAQCVDVLRPGGVAVVVGLAPEVDRAELEVTTMVRNQKVLMGSYYGSASPHETFGRILDFHQRGLIDVQGQVTRRYPLERVNEAYDDLIAGKPGRGVLVPNTD
jgi:S-(hydroxymethyl)glutathione dehydrogenase/alcohol dehydrogenase